MAPVDPGLYAADTTASTAIIAGLLGEHGPDLPVPSCPGWTLRNLATHVGRAHRWAAQIVFTRSAEFIPFRSVPDGRLPDDPAAQSGWLRAGAQHVIEAVQGGGQEQVWTFAGPQPASFWGRRMAHETTVHRADAELAAGRTPVLTPQLAADAADEWLGFLSGPVWDQQADPRLNALPEGKVLRVLATDGELAGASEWLISRTGPVIAVDASTAGRRDAPADVTLRGPAGLLLLVLTRRLPPSSAEILGDSSLLAQWLSNTPF
jgi:uncharacterized protein (TIGR03083 family)